MDALTFWRYKLAALLHDPPGKPLAMVSGTGGHAALAKRIAAAVGVDERSHYWVKTADHMASGADRPVVSPPRKSYVLHFQKEGRHLIVHPLAKCAWVLVAEGDGNMPRKVELLKALGDEQVELVREMATEAGLDWNDAASIEQTCYLLWRSLRHAIEQRRSGEAAERDLLWQHMPADTRCPDHSIWEHLRITSALAFRAVKKAGRQPWLFTFSLSPVQDFLRQSRTSRDLWIGSFLLSDLAWHAMLPVVERYGPDAVIYPDLRGNPRADSWLQQKRHEVLPPTLDDPASYAAVLPATFTAVVPVGGAGHLVPLAKLGSACQEAVTERWQELAETVREWLAKTPLGKGSWTETWKRHHARPPVSGTWNAVEWSRPETTEARQFGALLTEEGEEPLDPATLAKIERRRQRLEPWVPPATWTHHEQAREVFGRTHPNYLKKGGFEYALLHHQLRTRHAFRKATPSYPPIAGERGEKCTVCRQRAALFNEEQTEPAASDEQLEIDHHRSKVRALWSDIDDRGDGRDRLCGVCALKRFLVRASAGDAGGFNELWAGRTELARMADGGTNPSKDEVRVPFPATATVAAQVFLAEVAKHPELAKERKDIDSAHEAALRSVDATKFRTSFARSLARLAAAEQHGDGFLELDTQTSIFPSAVRGRRDLLEEEGEPAAKTAWETLYAKVGRLRERATTLGIAPPRTRFAVVRLDGDRLGALLLGDPDRVEARWRDVLHPVQRAYMTAPDKALAQVMADAGWPALFDARRLMGPSLHAFISRVLADFSHKVVPWVVEREFGGRLIYAGGDDLLALAPADDALPMAARLAQVFAAAWVVDTDPQGDPWSWRRRDRVFTYDQAVARRRFVVARRAAFPDDAPLELPLGRNAVEPPIGQAEDRQAPETDAITGELLAMMGPGASLSAGIAYGHFKTPLGHLLAESGRLLTMAKERAGRSAVALSYASRGGEKASIALPWQQDDRHGRHDQPSAYAMISRLTEGFGKGTLPGRLPYKLREDSRLLASLLARADDESPGLDAEQRGELMRGLLRRATSDQPLSAELERAVLGLWMAGLRLRPEEPERSAEGLLVCRGLAADTGEEDLG